MPGRSHFYTNLYKIEFAAAATALGSGRGAKAFAFGADNEGDAFAKGSADCLVKFIAVHLFGARVVFTVLGHDRSSLYRICCQYIFTE